MDNNNLAEPPLMNKKGSELTQEQLYERIVYKIRKKYNGAISMDEAHAAARTMRLYSDAVGVAGGAREA
jgi:uncharacterized protein (DUF2384 family)